MKILYVCTEMFPLLKTGGLGDVNAALPPALRDAGCDVRVLLPGFPAIRAGVSRSRLPPASPLALPDGDGPRLAKLGLTRPPSLQPAILPGSGMAAYVLDVRALFDRPGDPYDDAHGDNGIRFALLGWAAACLGLGLDPHWQPDVVHCHDWHTGLAPLYLRQMAMPGPPPAATVFTIHNLAYQGIFPRSLFGQLGLSDSLFGIDGIEFWGQVSFMKSGLQFADRITTVSPTYAREILGAEQGCGLDGLLRARSGVVSGILNGVDYEVWSPSHDGVLAHPYDWDSLENKGRAKAELQRKMGLQTGPADAMVFGVVSRLTEQKGLNLVEAVADELVHMGGQLAVLGTGDGPLEQAFQRAAGRNPGQIAVEIGYNEPLAHAVVAGADVILVPSRFEPCGLTQLYGLRYGSLPLVHRVGGLADTVVDATAQNLEAGRATGFAFDEFSTQGLRAAVRRAVELHAQPDVWAKVQQTAMKQRFDWREAARRYVALYRSLKPHAA